MPFRAPRGLPPPLISLCLYSLVACLTAQNVPFHRANEKGQAPAVQLGTFENSFYRNPFFGFRCALPFGWVDRTRQMRDQANEGNKSLLLLAVFERPPDAPGQSVNSAVLITAESRQAYPELKTSADYFVPLSDVAIGKGFEVVNPPYNFKVGLKPVVRADFRKRIGQVTMYQSSLAILDKGYFVCLTFLGGSEDEVNELMEKVRFDPPRSKPAVRPPEP